MASWCDTIPCCVLVVVIVGIRVLFSLHSHLWLDEAGTFWATGGGWKELASRCQVFPLSYLYAALILGLRSAGATSEWMLRVPSLVAMTLAGWLLFRMSARRWGVEAAWLSVALLFSLPEVSFAAADARPYAFAFLSIVLATSLLPQFLENPGWLSGFWYAAAAALTVHFHLLFTWALVAHALYLAYEWMQGRRPPLRYIVWVGVVFTLSIAPIAGYIRAVSATAKTHDFSASPNLTDLMNALTPPSVEVCAAAVLACIVTLTPEIELRADGLALAALLGFVAPLGSFAGSHISKTNMLLPRYRMFCTVGQALCFGALAASIRPRRIAQAVALALLGISLISLARGSALRHAAHLGDWGSALAFVDRETASDGATILMRSQFIESDYLPMGPVNGNPLFAPLSYYPSRSHFVGLRASFGPIQAAQADPVLAESLAHSRRFLLMATEGPSPIQPLIWYVLGCLGPGAQQHTLADFDSLQVIEFTPSPTPR